MEKSAEPNLFITRLHQADDEKEAIQSWGRTLHAMNVLGFSDNEVSAICAVMAAIYHLGVAGATSGWYQLCVVLYLPHSTLYASAVNAAAVVSCLSVCPLVIVT